MTDVVLIANKSSSSPDSIETFYSSPAGERGTRINSFSASNNTTSSKTYKAYIYDSTGAAVEPIIPQTIVVRDKLDNGAGLINQVIPAGGTLRIESSDTSSINFYATGLPQ